MKFSLWKAAAVVGTLVFSAMWAAPMAAQEPPKKESVAEAARRARAERERKKAAEKQARTFDNDNLPTPKEGESINVIGQPAAAPGTTPGQAAAPGASAEDAKAKEQDRQKVSEQLKGVKAQLEDAKKDLEIAKRAFDLDRDTYYSNPNFQSDKAGKVKLDSEQTDIAAKQQAVDQIQHKIIDLEEKLKAAGTPEQK
ncbi:MAG TPA: hypothetical protein VEU31_01650 [Candidatus Acidoferrales bacterium]|nr:hypothetical protein [Candidatus Acidoferrales bacterium]